MKRYKNEHGRWELDLLGHFPDAAVWIYGVYTLVMIILALVAANQ